MKLKSIKQSHTSPTQKGMGDFYGQGIRNPVGKIRDSSMVPKVKSLKKPPKSLA